MSDSNVPHLNRIIFKWLLIELRRWGLSSTFLFSIFEVTGGNMITRFQICALNQLVCDQHKRLIIPLGLCSRLRRTSRRWCPWRDKWGSEVGWPPCRQARQEVPCVGKQPPRQFPCSFLPLLKRGVLHDVSFLPPILKTWFMWNHKIQLWGVKPCSLCCNLPPSPAPVGQVSFADSGFQSIPMTSKAVELWQAWSSIFTEATGVWEVASEFSENYTCLNDVRDCVKLNEIQGALEFAGIL